MFVKDEIATSRLRLRRLASSCIVASVVLAASLAASASLIAAHAAEPARPVAVTQPLATGASLQDARLAADLRIRDGLAALALAGTAGLGFAIWRRRLRGLVIARIPNHAF